MFCASDTVSEGDWDLFNSFWPSNAIWGYGTLPTLVQVMACHKFGEKPFPDGTPIARWPRASKNYQSGKWIWAQFSSMFYMSRSKMHNFVHQVCEINGFVEPHLKENTIICINLLRPSDAIWQQITGLTLAQVMASCLTAPSHYLNQWWLIISKVCAVHTRTISEEIPQPWIIKISLKITSLKFLSNLLGANDLKTNE